MHRGWGVGVDGREGLGRQSARSTFWRGLLHIISCTYPSLSKTFTVNYPSRVRSRLRVQAPSHCSSRLPRFSLLLSKTLRAIRSPCFRSLSCWRLFEFRAYEGNNFSKYQFSVDWLLIGLAAMNSSLPVEFYRQEDFGNGRQTLGDAQSLKTKNPLCIWDRCNQFNQFYR